LLEKDGDLPAIRFGHEQVGEAVTIQVGPFRPRLALVVLFSGSTWNWPRLKAPTSDSAGFFSKCETWARPNSARW
jgi:hypothetical protein